MSIVLSKPTITREDLESVLESLINDELAAGASVKNFESAVAGITGHKYSLAVNSATAAYHLAFRALEIREESEVIIPSFFSQAPLSALTLCRGKAVLADNEDNALFPSPGQIKEKITEHTKGVVLGHTFGFHFPTGELKNLGIPVIEDISHAIGTMNDEAPAGQNSAFAVLSFDPSMIITTGIGGMVLSNNSRHYSLMRDLRMGGGEQLHLDYAMTDFQGAMGLSQLKKLGKLLSRRRDIARVYYDAARTGSHRTLMAYNEHFAYQSFPVIFDAPIDKVDKYWKKNKIEVINPVSVPLHKILGLPVTEYLNSDRLSKKLFSIPLYPTLTKKEIERISRLFSSFI